MLTCIYEWKDGKPIGSNMPSKSLLVPFILTILECYNTQWQSHF